jgi:hypothetical protein
MTGGHRQRPQQGTAWGCCTQARRATVAATEGGTVSSQENTHFMTIHSCASLRHGVRNTRHGVMICRQTKQMEHACQECGTYIPRPLLWRSMLCCVPVQEPAYRNLLLAVVPPQVAACSAVLRQLQVLPKHMFDASTTGPAVSW